MWPALGGLSPPLPPPAPWCCFLWVCLFSGLRAQGEIWKVLPVPGIIPPPAHPGFPAWPAARWASASVFCPAPCWDLHRALSLDSRMELKGPKTYQSHHSRARLRAPRMAQSHKLLTTEWDHEEKLCSQGGGNPCLGSRHPRGSEQCWPGTRRIFPWWEFLSQIWVSRDSSGKTF